MKKIKIEYYSDTLIPKEIEDLIELTHKRIMDNRYEPDKINIDISNLKSGILKWIVNMRCIESCYDCDTW